MNISITGTGSYVPDKIITNDSFKEQVFHAPSGKCIPETTEVLTQKFQAITGITERRYVQNDQLMSDIAAIAAQRAISDAGIDPETINGIILAHTFGDVAFGKAQTDIIPAIASRVKHKLGIISPNCIAFDVLFGCPGWLQGLILARQSILTENAGRFLVIGAETLSRVIDPFDRDSMIFSDGAAAAIIEKTNGTERSGIIASTAKTYAGKEAYYLYYGESYQKESESDTRYIKMFGQKIYEFALKYVPEAMKLCLERSGIPVEKLKKIFLHQANEKMDEAIVRDFYKLYNIKSPPASIMPMNINKLGNSSVATIPTLLDMVLKNQQPEHQLEKGDVILMASVGAGMNINAITYIM